MHTTDFLFISLSDMAFISGVYSSSHLFFFSPFISPPGGFLFILLCLFQTYCFRFSRFWHPPALCHKQRRWWLFLPDWVWKCAMINMLLWLLISSNGSVKLQCLDKYWRWSNICGAAQRHNEGKQLEFIGYKSMKAAVVFGHKSRIRIILKMPELTLKSVTRNLVRWVI